MPAAAWLDQLEELNQVFSILDGAGSLASSLDEGLKDLLQTADNRAAMRRRESVNRLYVEDLLADCIDRVSNCLTIRAQAQQVENRAIEAALSYKVENTSLDIQTSIRTLLDPLAGRMPSEASGLRRSPDDPGKARDGDGFEFVGDTDLWTKVRKKEAEIDPVIKEALATRKQKSKTPGNASNFVERFSYLKRLFDMNMVQAYTRALDCADGLHAVYDFKGLEVPDITEHSYLDDLSLWVQRAADELDAELDSRYLSEVAIPIAGMTAADPDYGLIATAKFTDELKVGRIAFSLSEEFFRKRGMKDPLLRSLRVQVQPTKPATTAVAWPMDVLLPTHTLTVQEEERFPAIAQSHYQPVVNEQAVVRGVHNMNPIGKWSIEVGPRAVSGEERGTTIGNVHLFLSVWYRRA